MSDTAERTALINAVVLLHERCVSRGEITDYNAAVNAGDIISRWDTADVRTWCREQGIAPVPTADIPPVHLPAGGGLVPLVSGGNALDWYCAPPSLPPLSARLRGRTGAVVTARRGEGELVGGAQGCTHRWLVLFQSGGGACNDCDARLDPF